MQDRIALVIGNASYTHATPLKAPKEDAAAMAGVLEGLGFTVVQGYDCDFAVLRTKLADFLGRLGEETTALFYFSGHGAQTPDRSNYILTVEADIDHPDDLGRFGRKVDEILTQMRARAKVSLMFLDACRDDPFAAATPALRTRGVVARRPGLAVMPRENLGQALIAHAAEEGHTAIDPDHGLGPFTQALCDHLATPGKEIREVLSLVRRDVVERTQQRQRPWTNESLEDRVVLAPVEEDVVEEEEEEEPPTLPPPSPPLSPPPQSWRRIVGLSLVAYSVVLGATFMVKPDLLCSFPGLETLSFCPPDPTTREGLARLVDDLDAADDTTRGAAQFELMRVISDPEAATSRALRKYLVQELLAAADPERFAARSVEGRLSLMFVLAEIPDFAWEDDFLSLRASARAIHAGLDREVKAGRLVLTDGRIGLLDEFGRRVGALTLPEARPAPDEPAAGGPTPIEDTSPAPDRAVVAFLDELKSTDPRSRASGVVGMKEALGSGELSPTSVKWLVGNLVDLAKSYLQESTAPEPWSDLLDVLSAVRAEDWRLVNSDFIADRARNLFVLVDESLRTGILEFDVDARRDLALLLENSEAAGLAEGGGYLPYWFTVRVRFAGYTRQEIVGILARLADHPYLRFDGDILRTEAAAGKNEVRSWSSSVSTAVIKSVKPALLTETGNSFDVFMDPTVAEGIVEFWMSE